MAEDVGIVMTLYDRVSPTLKTIAGNSKSFDKALDELEAGLKDWETAQDTLVSKQSSLKKALAESTIKVQEAQKSYKKLKDEASKGALDTAIDEQSRLKQELTETEKSLKAHNQLYDDMYSKARQAAKGVKELSEEKEKEEPASQKPDGSGGNGSNGTGLADGILKSGLLKEAANSLSGAVNAYMTSAIGEPAAQLASQMVGGAMNGASAGAFLGIPGMLLGGAIGATSGAVSGVTAIEQAKDSSFTSYVQEAVEGQLEAMESIRTSGSTTAGQREQDQIAFAQRFGSDEAAEEYLDRVKAMAVNTNYSYDEITGYSKSLLNTYSAEKTLDVLQKLSDASAGLNLDTSGVSAFIKGLSNMRTTGKVTQEYLNYYSERGLDVYSAIAEGRTADGKATDKSQVSQLVTKGKISGADAAQYILDYIQEQYGGLSEKLASTYDAMVDNLGDAEANLNARMGEGYNEARKEGIAEQSDWLESDALGEAYEAIGAWKASLENAKEQYIRDAVDTAMASDDYKRAQAEGDAAEMGRIIMQAQIQGMNEYNDNEGKDEVLAQQTALIDGVRNDAELNEDYWNAGYVLGQEFSKGRAAAMIENQGFSVRSSEDMESLNAGLVETADDVWAKVNGYAYGLDRVPYDGFPALLHEGERVLTASEARQTEGGGVSVKVSVGQMVVREEADVQKVAEALLEEARLQAMAGVYET